MFNFFIENWHMIVIGLAVIVAAVFFIIRFFKQSDQVKYEQIRGWLLQAIILAEQEYGSGTGRMKLSAVYDAFCIALPWIARVISFETFAKYVDEALEEAKEILAKNAEMAALAETMVNETSVTQAE